MTEVIKTNQIKLEELIGIHVICDADFIPPLSQRVKISDYCRKIFSNAEIISYHRDGELQGIVAMYCNDTKGHTAYISSICVHPEGRGQKVGGKLLDYSISLALEKGMEKIGLEVGKTNSPALILYASRGFSVASEGIETVFMEKEICISDKEHIIDSLSPLVSIIMVTYNHGQFISDAIEGCLMQKTDFSVELIIADDASSDENQQIIKQYAEKNPEIIRPILRPRNIGANPNWFDAFSRSKGRYIAICEGDDYWTDPLKLQKQVDLLEADKSIGMVCTGYSRFYQLSGILKRHCFDTEKYRDEVRFRDYILDMSTIGTATVMIRKDIVKNFLTELPQEVRDTFIGSDTPLWLFTGVHSKIAVIPDDTAVYRFLENSACHFSDPEDHYKFVLKGFKMANYFFERYGNNDRHLFEQLNRKKLKASLFHGYRTMNRNLAKESYAKLTAYNLSFRLKMVALLMLTGSYNRFLNAATALVLNANKPALSRKNRLIKKNKITEASVKD